MDISSQGVKVVHSREDPDPREQVTVSTRLSCRSPYECLRLRSSEREVLRPQTRREVKAGVPKGENEGHPPWWGPSPHPHLLIWFCWGRPARKPPRTSHVSCPLTGDDWPFPLQTTSPREMVRMPDPPPHPVSPLPSPK